MYGAYLEVCGVTSVEDAESLSGAKKEKSTDFKKSFENRKKLIYSRLFKELTLLACTKLWSCSRRSFQNMF